MSYRRRLKKKNKETFLVFSAASVMKLLAFHSKNAVSRMNCTCLGMLLTCLITGLTYVFTSLGELNNSSYLVLICLCVASTFRLLTEDPNERLGAKGAAEVKEVPFFSLPSCRTLVHVVSLQNVCFLLGQ